MARSGRSYPARPIVSRSPVGERGGASTITGTVALSGAGAKQATAGAPARLSNSAEGGTPGAAVTAGTGGSGNAWDVVTTSGAGALVYDDTHTLGTLAYKVTNSATTNNTLTWNTSLGTRSQVWGRVCLYLAALPAANVVVAWLLSGSQTARVNINPAGKVELRDAANTVLATSANTIPTGQWIRIEWHCIALASGGTIEARLYASPSALTATEALAATGALRDGVSEVSFGQQATGAGTVTLWLDDLAVGISGWIGPVSPTTSGTVMLAGSGAKQAAGSSTITAVLSLSASGTKLTGIGSVPRPRIRWQFIAGPAWGGHDLALTEAKGRRFTARLTDPSELGFSLNGRHPQADAIGALYTDVHVLWTSDAGDTRELFRGRTGSKADRLTDTEHATEVAVLDYRAVLNRRNLFSGDQLTWAATDQAEIVWGLLSQTQGNVGGDIGISKGWSGTTPTGVFRDRTYELGDSIGERIQELSEVIDGFDWDITPVSESGLELQVWYPRRGSDRGVVLEYGGLVAGVNVETNPADYANALRMTGDDNATPAVAAVEREAADLAGRPEGRWDKVVGDTGLTTQAALDERANWQIATSQVVTPTITLTLKQDAWEGPDHIWVGDPVQVVIVSGGLYINQTLRVYEMAFGIGDNGDESVELTVGGPKPDPRKIPSLIGRRLTNLERR